MSETEKGHYRLGQPGLDVYPVGVLHDIRVHGWRGLGRTLRYLRRQARRGEWRAVKNTFNGYLAEPRSFPKGVTRCGSGWTPGRAVRSLNRQQDEAQA